MHPIAFQTACNLAWTFYNVISSVVSGINSYMVMGSYYIHYVRFITTVAIISIGPFICGMFNGIKSHLDSIRLGISLGFSSSVSAQLLIGDNLIAFFSSLINLGALVGSLIVGPVLNILGRRAALRISAVPSIIGWLLIAAAQGLSPPSTSVDPLLVFFLLLGRVLSGLAAGMMTAVGSVYLVEVSPPHQSGRIGSLAQFATVAGTCFAYYCGMVTTWYETAELMAVISVMLLGVTFYLPESPAWLAKRNRIQAALKSLSWLRFDQKAAVQELSDLSADSIVDAEKPSFLPPGQHTFRNGANDHTFTSCLVRLLLPCVTIPPELSDNLRIALLLMVAQQTTGINVITFYTEPLCQRMVHVTHSARCAFALGLAQLFFSLLASFLIINRLPRRLLVVATGVLMSISMFFFAIGQQFPNSAPISPLAAIMVFLMGYQCGWGPLAMLVVLELFPASHRGAACAAAVAINWGVTFLVTQAFQPLVNLLDGQGELVVFLAHSVVTFFASAYFYRRLPETNPVFVSPVSAGVAAGLFIAVTKLLQLLRPQFLRNSNTLDLVKMLSPVVPSLALVGFLLGFQFGWGPLAMLVSTELFPPEHRGTVGGAAVAINWITSFIVTQTFQPFVNALGGGTFSGTGDNNVGSGEVVIFLFYSAITTFATIWLHRRLPETNKAFLPSAVSASLL
ncbi:unnamed protein product [Hydatigera taeniaeformis]|uniref:MFS domain-containing protein n=1 Tax=Hydatigena taeniaeformis TaxID=6205 RepID=A0A0R3X3Y7_HYDTA|nr:unnamed protein product [Hydatigera taeniaeformis]